LRVQVWDGDCSAAEDRQLIMDVMMAVLNVDMKQLDNREAARGTQSSPTVVRAVLT